MSDSSSSDDFVDFYELLGVSPDSDAASILKVYRKVALRSHPDRNPDDPQATVKFALIVEAKDVLTQSELSRREYHAKWQARQAQKQARKAHIDRMDRMSAEVRKSRSELERREARLEELQRAHARESHFKRMKKQRLSEELASFAEELRNEQAKEELIQRVFAEKRAASKNATVMVCWPEEGKPYRRSQLKSVFSVYGKVESIEVDSERHCARISFRKAKNVRKVLNDGKSLQSDFDLSVTVLKHHSESETDGKKSTMEDWMNTRRRMRESAGIPHSGVLTMESVSKYQSFVSKLIE